MPKIIQFLHPNQEATPLNSDDKFIPWNNNKTHRRKFLLSKGKFINQKGEAEESELAFWGEWEAQSYIIPIGNARQTPPKYFNVPFLDLSVPDRTHTTDPYVFGRNFKYFICRQHRNRHILKNLDAGSIILFGSSINGRFCLDTLFVVSDIKRKYNSNTVDEVFPKDKRGQFYFACIDPIYGYANCNLNVEVEDNCRANRDEEFVCYEAVSFSEKDKFEQIYSFVPCKIYLKDKSNDSIFIQPEINLDFISPAQTMGINSKECSMQDIQNYWEEISKQLEAQDLLQGVFFKTPPIKQINGA